MHCTGPWKLATIPLYIPLKSPKGAHVHKTTYGPLIDTALYIDQNAFDAGKTNIWARGRGWALEKIANMCCVVKSNYIPILILLLPKYLTKLKVVVMRIKGGGDHVANIDYLFGTFGHLARLQALE